MKPALLLLLLAGCAKHVSVKAPVVERGTYAYQLNGNTYTVAAANQVEFNKALKEIGCGDKAVCATQMGVWGFVEKTWTSKH